MLHAHVSASLGWWLIVGELSKELVKLPAMLTRTKLYKRIQYDELVATVGGEGIDLLPYVNRRLLDRVAA